MSAVPQMPVVWEVVTSVLLLGGSVITLIGTFGLLRLGTFYQRVHAPTLGTTLGTALVTLASIIYFSMLQDRLVLYELMIIVFIIVTTPISLTVLVRAALLRDRRASAGKAEDQPG